MRTTFERPIESDTIDGMTMAQKREAAFALYIQGLSLRQVATEIGVGRATVERWSSRDFWGIQRQRAWNQKREEISSQYAKNEARRDRTIAGHLFELLEKACFDRRAYFEGKMPKRALRTSTADILRLAKALAAIGDADLRRAVYFEYHPDRSSVAPAQSASEEERKA